MSKKPKKRKDPRVESQQFEEIEITDPVTGKKSIQKVLVTRYKPIEKKPVGNKGVPDEEVELEDLEDILGEG
jgi:hypothetical protein